MTGLSEETQQKRTMNVVNASELHRIMGGYDDPEPERPDTNFEGFDDLYKTILPLYNKGDKSPNVKPLSEALGFKVSAAMRDATVKFIGLEKPKEIPKPIITYAHERVKAMLFRDDEYDDVSTYQLRIGQARESDAIIELGKWAVKQGLIPEGSKFEFTGDNQKHESRNGVGATPDGLAPGMNDLTEFGGETKCFAPERHLECWLIKDQRQLRKEQFDIFCQTQAGMYAHELKRWLIGFHNPWAREDPKLKFRGLEVTLDEFFISKMEERVELCRSVIDERLAEIERLK